MKSFIYNNSNTSIVAQQSFMGGTNNTTNNTTNGHNWHFWNILDKSKKYQDKYLNLAFYNILENLQIIKKKY